MLRGLGRVLVTAALGLTFVAGCAPPAHSPGHPQPTTTPVRAASSQVAGFNGTDRAWLQLMIPMNEQGVRLLELVPARAPDPATRQLAAQVAAGYRAELDQLRALRARAGVPTTNIHEGHELPGLLTATDLRAAERARGAELGRLVTGRLRAQFEQGVVLCRGERTSGADPATKALAAAIERTRAARLGSATGGLGPTG